MIDIWQEIYSTIKRNKLRTFLTGFAVAWGIFMLIVLLGAGNGLIHAFEQSASERAMNSIKIFPGWTSKSYDGLKEGRRVQLDNKDMDATSHYFPNHVIKAGATVWQGGVNLSFGQEYVSLNLSGVYPNHTEVEVVKLFEGRFINEIDIKERRKVIVLHKKTAEILFNKTHTEPIGQFVNAGNVVYQVVGLYNDKGDSGDSDAYIPFTTLQTIYNKGVVAYFSLFALLGAATVGIREIAICNGDFEKRSKVFSSVMVVIGVLTGISLILMSVSIFLISRFQEYSTLLLIGSFSLVFTSLQIEWLYQGVEKFDYIAKRTIFIRILYCISIFLFVHDKEDYLIYYILTVGIVVVNGFINLIYSRNYVHFSFKNVEIKKYLKPVAMYGVNKILISMYTTFNVMFLGLACNDIEVGFYSTANKLFTILLGVISAFTSVVLPRMASLVANNNVKKYNDNISKSFSLIFSVSLPICIGGMLLSPQIIDILAGSGYEGAILPMQIIMPVVVLTGAAQVCIMQALIPLKEDKAVLLASVIGAATAVLFNIIFVDKLGAIGSALVLLCSEICSDIFAFGYAIKKKILTLPWRFIVKRIISSIPYIAICYTAGKCLNLNNIATLLIALLICGFYFVVESLFVLKLPIVRDFFAEIKKQIR